MRKDRKIIGVAAAFRESDGTQDLGIPAQIVRAGNQLGWRIVDLRTWQFEVPRNLGLDGLIFNLPPGGRETIYRLLAKTPFAVSINHNHGIAELSVVEGDSKGVGTRVADYYLDRGYRNLAICSFYPNPNREELCAFEEYAKAKGASCKRLHTNPGDTDMPLDEQFLCFKSQLMQQALPLAIFCTNDRLAARICQWCIDMHRAVPEQVAIMGAGNHTFICESGPVPISSISPFSHSIGTEAVKLLQRIMDGKVKWPAHFRMPAGEIVTRRSTDMQAIDNLVLARASRYIEDHYNENIGLNEVAAACRTPLRTLTSAFNVQFGVTINAYINRHRIAKACELLSQTNHSAADIAARSGFLSAQTFSRKFKQVIHMTPLEYRKKDREHRHFPQQ